MLVLLLSLTLIFWFAVTIDAAVGFRQLHRLEQEPGLSEGPLLSVVVAARNEENTINQSIKSQLGQTYGNIEWVLVNDRSTDQTGRLMDQLALMDKRVSAIQIDKLPPGWLGKNHALYKGAKKASGNLLLFTDADVVYKADAFGKAVHYFTRHKLDHMTAAPSLYAKSFWLKAFISFFLFGFSFYKRPWLANRTGTKNGIGIGAFNLLTHDAYKAVGTHAVLKMRPDDDLQLGLKIKQSGLRQRIVTALSLIEVEWYPNLNEALRGLEKNTFAGLHYRISMVVFAIFGVFTANVLPFFTVLSSDKLTSMLSIANIVILALLSTLITKKMTIFSPWLFVAFPLTALLFIFSIIRATFLTVIRGGIIWRGTKYKLSELRKND
nr:glycosyltransferase family 2 protein [Mesobacillus harenae]